MKLISFFKMAVSAVFILICAGATAIGLENLRVLQFPGTPNDCVFLLIAFVGVIIGGGIAIKITQLLFWRDCPLLRKSLIILPCAFAVLLAIPFVFQPHRTCARLALSEYFRPTTMETMPLAPGCVSIPTDAGIADTPMIQSEEKMYGLTVQTVSVCRLPQSLPGEAPEVSNALFNAGTQDKWLRIFLPSCCAYHFRRHFTVVLVSAEADGSSRVTRINLIQSRKDYVEYLRWHCDQQLSAFF